MPVVFVLVIVFTIWSIYGRIHLSYLLQTGIFAGSYDDTDSSQAVQAQHFRGWVQFYISQFLTGMLLFCFGCAIFVDPGAVPSEPDWLPQDLTGDQEESDSAKHTAQSNTSAKGTSSCSAIAEETSAAGASLDVVAAEGGPVGAVAASAKAALLGKGASKGDSALGVSSDAATGNLPLVREEKVTGGRRWCKWCMQFKPDRCHHCRVCRICVLRMDHHCPWVANCVGYRNHKFFLLLVFYSVLASHFIIFTMLESVLRVLAEETEFWVRFQLVFGITLASMMALTVSAFLAFHLWMVINATTTIEFCEKRWARPMDALSTTTNPGDALKTINKNKLTTSMYDLGTLENFRAVLGPRVWLWWLPIDLPQDGGLRFQVSAEARKQAVSDEQAERSKSPPPAPAKLKGKGKRKEQKQIADLLASSDDHTDSSEFLPGEGKKNPEWTGLERSEAASKD